MNQDSQYRNLKFSLSEIEHHYGTNVHILSDPFLLSHLAALCSPEVHQPTINQLMSTIYNSLLTTVVNLEFPAAARAIPTRMQAYHPEGVYHGPMIDPSTPVVSVNLARAGTLPSHLCYNALNYFMNPATVRQDHISIARQTDTQEKVTGSLVSGHKIGGPVEGAIVLFPDPMGATGSSIVEAIDLYKNPAAKLGRAKKFVTLHCIVTPEYIKRVTQAHPDTQIYAIRLDRGLSSKEILATVPGTHWDQERGLNHKHYIVPGGGGLGEVLNNAYV